MTAIVMQLSDGFPWVVDLVVRGALLLSLAGLLTLLLRRVSSASRHLLWTTAMLGLLVLPLAGLVVPDVRVTLPTALFPAERAAAVPGPDARVSGADAAGRADAPAFVDPSARSTSRGVRTGERDAPATSGAARPGGRAAVDPPAARAAVPLTGWLVGIWLLGALALLVPVAASVMAVRRFGARLDRLEASRIRYRATRLALRVGLEREVRLLEGDPGSMPMTFGVIRPAIVLPPAAREWSPQRLDAVLLHELAHVRRRDTLTQLVAELARALHWLNPLAWLAVRRLEVEREHACDDVALARGPRPSAYADELLGLARGYRTARFAGRAALAMARPGRRLSRRLLAVLDDDRIRREPGRAGAWKAAAAAAVVVALVGAVSPRVASADAVEGTPQPELMPDAPVSTPTIVTETARGPAFDAAPAASTPSLQEATCIAGPGEWNRISTQSNNGRRTVNLERRGCEVEVRFEGDVEFDAAGVGIGRMSRDARVTFEEDDGRMLRSLEVVPGSGGGPAFEYRENRRAQEFDSAARAWYRSLLLELFRSTGFMAEARVRALLDQGGTEAVLRELGRLNTDLAYGKHVEALLTQARLGEAEVRALLRGSADRVDSDHYLAGILQAVAEHQPMNDGVLDDFLAATRRLESDHYRTQALGTALTSGRLTDAQVAATLESATEMDSDHYRTEILSMVADRYALQPGFRQTYLRATATMDSDHYRTQVLNRLLERNDLTADEKAAVLEAAAMIGSDHYRTELLANVARGGLGEPALHDAFFRAAAGLDSDHYYRQAMALLIAEPVEDALLVTVIRASARDMDSDHYKSELLLAILDGRQGAISGTVRDAFLEAMDSMDSEHYRGRVASALLRGERQ